jgi:HEXXH motif-containing protein
VVLSAGWRLLVSGHRPVAAEVAAVHCMLVPLRPAGPAQASATPSDAFGAVAMSLPPDPRTAALTFAHEAQHAKLAVLADLFPLVDNGAEDRRFYAPWRPDPRPPSALLQGIYAHLAVAGFWRGQRLVERGRQDADVEFDRWRTVTRDVTVTLLDSGVLTPIGTRFVAGILGVLEGWRSDPVPQAARAAARRLARQHRDRWCRTHGRSGVPVEKPGDDARHPLRPRRWA